MCAAYVVINNVWTRIAAVHEITLGNKLNNIMVSGLNNPFSFSFSKSSKLTFYCVVINLTNCLLDD
jgi:hypothetical protein